MSRTLSVCALFLAVAIVVVVVATADGRPPVTIALPPGSQHMFPAEHLVAGDRFTCHGSEVTRQSPGFSFLSSTGVASATAPDGTVMIRCPKGIAPV